MGKKTYWAIMRIFKWESMELKQSGKYQFPFPVYMAKPEGGEIGYIPVFDSREAAVKFNDGREDNIAMLQDV
jgi:hypothetical protein